MIKATSMTVIWQIIMAVIFLPLLVEAQQPTTAPTVEAPGVERFRFFERTYQDGLKRIHLPLLTGYLTKLNQLASDSKEPNPSLDQEITWVQKTMADGGLIDLDKLGLPEVPKMEASPASAGPDSPPGAVLVLKAEKAKGGTLSKSSSPALTLGEASWTVDRLPAGSYEVLALYCLPTMVEGASLVISLGENVFTHELSKDRSTKPDQFRILRLGRLTLDQEIVSGTFQIKMTPATAIDFQIRQIIIAKPRPPKPAK